LTLINKLCFNYRKPNENVMSRDVPPVGLKCLKEVE